MPIKYKVKYKITITGTTEATVSTEKVEDVKRCVSSYDVDDVIRDLATEEAFRLVRGMNFDNFTHEDSFPIKEYYLREGIEDAAVEIGKAEKIEEVK